MIKLNVNHVTQTGNKWRGDCGPAVVSMITVQTIKQSIIDCDMKPNQYAHFYNLTAGLRKHSINSKFEYLSVSEIKDAVRAGLPVICLIGYNHLPNELKRSSFNGAHFVLAVGCGDNHVLVHDPLGTAVSGAYVAYPDIVMSRIMQNVRGNTYNNQCLIIYKKMAIESDNVNDFDSLAAAVTNVIDRLSEFETKPNGKRIVAKSYMPSTVEDVLRYGNGLILELNQPIAYPERWYFNFEGIEGKAVVSESEYNSFELGDIWRVTYPQKFKKPITPI